MTKQFDAVKDSGARQNFQTGSVRDTDAGKGKPHLVAGEPFIRVKEYLKSSGICYVEGFSQDRIAVCNELEKALLQYTQLVENREDNISKIYQAIDLTCMLIALDEGKGYYTAFTRLSIHYENGAKKYAANNWRLGQPISRYYDSAKRHFDKIMDGWTDEDHYAALLWNLVAIVQTKIDIERGVLPKELNDYPFTLAEVFNREQK